MKGGEVEVFEGKTLSQILEDVYENSLSTKNDIKTLIKDLVPFMQTSSDAVNIAPIIHSFVDVGVKNNEQLIKVATVVQRLISADAYQRAGDESILSESDREQLLQNAVLDMKQSEKEVSDEITNVKLAVMK